MLDISDYDKDQLAEYAKKEFGVDLDMRKKLENLKADVVKMQQKPLAPVEETQKVSASHIKNKDTNLIFPYNKQIAEHLGERGMLCNESGEPA